MLTALVRVHLICAAATTFAAGIVITLPTSVPKLAGLPVLAALASLHVNAVAAKFVAGVSVIVTAVLKAVTLMTVGEAGVAVLAAVVVMAVGLEAKLVDEKVNGPPMAAVVIFCKVTVVVWGVLVNVQVTPSP